MKSRTLLLLQLEHDLDLEKLEVNGNLSSTDFTKKSNSLRILF